MNKKTLIADTHDIFDAFIINGLHLHYCIYCQFPFNVNLLNKYHYGNHFDIEFNDGYRCHNKKAPTRYKQEL
ncbi:3-deoxy-7-phosphoheptulonate synthase [Photobacterium iliopiscarium]|jgi:hypothetical protein|uniref:Uncharacterized protein n=1 Tax=Photobacterium iliopiscarium TaxID=56192 RepID=A0A0D8P597_9GAMM|nr:hypothetical protein [Photobacterium iliopiscarium]KJG12134.1 3-deoxy-7-phosphoheptulonate synthase [Photobacterium iliopiscarium]KJG23070.1 3-deoxy-7-phosphoheptulonate synthase [Photobacterium iliopiscarium]PST96080.1 hypothetical protein C9I87_05945 [Photobacterium iliopiscarium]PST99600.1 hypothetical protein C9I85_10305 [Photobacterium iliopiscarium]PSV82924.1 hypothetical protein C9J51_10330 [Photobacterium iliopiscarium]